MDFQNDITIPIFRGLIIIVAIGAIFTCFIICYKVIEVKGLEVLVAFCCLVIIVLAFAWFLGFALEDMFGKKETEE